MTAKKIVSLKKVAKKPTAATAITKKETQKKVREIASTKAKVLKLKQRADSYRKKANEISAMAKELLLQKKSPALSKTSPQVEGTVVAE